MKRCRQMGFIIQYFEAVFTTSKIVKQCGSGAEAPSGVQRQRTPVGFRGRGPQWGLGTEAPNLLRSGVSGTWWGLGSYTPVSWLKIFTDTNIEYLSWFHFSGCSRLLQVAPGCSGLSRLLQVALGYLGCSDCSDCSGCSSPLALFLFH